MLEIMTSHEHVMTLWELTKIFKITIPFGSFVSLQVLTEFTLHGQEPNYDLQSSCGEPENQKTL